VSTNHRLRSGNISMGQQNTEKLAPPLKLDFSEFCRQIRFWNTQCLFYRVPKHDSLIAQRAWILWAIPWQLPRSWTRQKGMYILSSLTRWRLGDAPQFSWTKIFATLHAGWWQRINNINQLHLPRGMLYYYNSFTYVKPTHSKIST
jgi:hypothetical protein